MESSNSSSESTSLWDYRTVVDRAGRGRGRDDYFFKCPQGPLMRTIQIPWTDIEAVHAHKAICPYCIKGEQERLQEQRLKNEGPRRVQYCLAVISKAKEDIRFAKDKKEEAENKRARGEQLDGFEQEKLRLALYDGGVAEETIKKERIELHKLLNHQNEIIRKGANEEYEKYLSRINKIKKNKKKEKEKWVVG